MCANSEGSGETARDAQARQSHRWDSHLCDKYLNLLSWLKFHSNQESSSGLKEARGRLLVNLVPMLEKKKKIFFFFFFPSWARRSAVIV